MTTTPPPAMWVRIALHLHRAYVLNATASAQSDNSYAIVSALMGDAPRTEVGNWYRPRYFLCLNCGKIERAGTVLRHQFHAACSGCVDYSPLSCREHIASGYISTPWSSLTRNLLLYESAVQEIDKYLCDISLTGCSPFDILIGSIQAELL